MTNTLSATFLAFSPKYDRSNQKYNYRNGRQEIYNRYFETHI